MKIKIVFCGLLLLPVMALAENRPTPTLKDARVKIVPYQEDNVVPVYGRTFTTTQIIFGSGEYVKGVEGGDSAGWIVDYKDKLPNMIFIKPTVFDSNSNMTVVTNRHSYYFKVKSNKSLNDSEHNVTYAIRFIYPEEERARLNARLKDKAMKQGAVLNGSKNPNAYNWNYRFSGNKQIMPLHVFDDGTFTYFELRKNQAVPAIFAVDEKDGKEAVINLRREGNYMVVQRLAPQFTLRNGGTVASVFNGNEIYRIRAGRG